jgi:hypothetical protein
VAARDWIITFVGTRPDLQLIACKAAERIGSLGYHLGEQWPLGTPTKKLETLLVQTPTDGLSTLLSHPKAAGLTPSETFARFSCDTGHERLCRSALKSLEIGGELNGALVWYLRLHHQQLTSI